nr:Rha family transcriptional regulator [Bacillus sp. UNC322MFChir4.1]
MNSLRLIKTEEYKTNELYIDSLEVAEMTGKLHKDLLRSIEGYIEVLGQSAKLRPDNFFVESTYQDSTGRKNKSYLLTRKGCDMVANKMTGERHNHLLRDTIEVLI